MNIRRISGEGTSESEWMACNALSCVPFIEIQTLIPLQARLVICAPHPDDEILPCGGLLAAASDYGSKIVVIAITDGEASHGDSLRESLRLSRPGETTQALELLGVDATILRFRMPDGKLSEFENSIANILRYELQPGDIVFTAWRWDGHPDHEATARASLKAVAELGSVLWEMPIWGWYWSKPNTTPNF